MSRREESRAGIMCCHEYGNESNYLPLPLHCALASEVWAELHCAYIVKVTKSQKVFWIFVSSTRKLTKSLSIKFLACVRAYKVLFYLLSSFFLLPTLIKYCQYVIYTHIQVLLIIFLIISDYFFSIFSDFFRFFKKFFRHF